MPYIENISLKQAVKGDHWNRGADSVLIQIVNPALGFPKTKVKFLEVHQFEILDEEPKFSEEQATAICKILSDALKSDRNVTVHCHMGIARSGAVAIIGHFMGFDLCTKNQVPNHRMQKPLECEFRNNYWE